MSGANEEDDEIQAHSYVSEEQQGRQVSTTHDLQRQECPSVHRPHQDRREDLRNQYRRGDYQNRPSQDRVHHFRLWNPAFQQSQPRELPRERLSVPSQRWQPQVSQGVVHAPARSNSEPHNLHIGGRSIQVRPPAVFLPNLPMLYDGNALHLLEPPNFGLRHWATYSNLYLQQPAYPLGLTTPQFQLPQPTPNFMSLLNAAPQLNMWHPRHGNCTFCKPNEQPTAPRNNP